MRTLLALPLLMLACIGTTTDKDDDPVQPTDTGDTGDTGNGTAPTDFDHDGYFSDVDCDDNNALVYPDAEELCDEIDNDCDEEVDEGFDNDGDGFNNMDDCESGDDCDDENANVYPGAPETEYDEIDQDCDGSDLTDVDGDGFVGEAVGGNDCDDWDDTVYPGADEIAKDGIDQDCDGLDDIDGDGDGYGDIDFGGDDCDDSDPEINPGAVDFSNDDIDTNCDDDTDTIYAIEDAPSSVTTDASSQGLVGDSIAMCDLDEDGFDDLVVGAPFDNSYTGRVGIWYGLDHLEWTADMAMSGADTRITGNSYGFLGFSALCDDFDGDGHQDLVIQRGEINYASVYVTEWSIMFFYGDGSGFGPSLTEADADAELVYELGVPAEVPSVYNNNASSGDLDGDGAAEIILPMGSADLTVFDGEQRIVVVSGGRYNSDGNLDEYISHTITPHHPEQVYMARPAQDLDGDGYSDVLVTSYLWSPNYDSASDEDSPIAGEFNLRGRLDVIGSLGFPSTDEDLDLESLAWGSHESQTDDLLYGFHAIDGDFDGDGLTDLMVSMYGNGPDGTENGGGLFFYSDAVTSLSAGEVVPETDADTIAYGDVNYLVLGYSMVNAGDVDGDGTDDVLVSAPGFGYTDSSGGTSYPSSSGWVYLVSGAMMTAETEVDNLRDVSLLAWRGEDTTYDTGSTLAAGGDIDGDGMGDVIIGERLWGGNGTGKAYIYLSSEF